MSEIYFIRHGQASFMAQDYDQLSPVGHRQARILADHLTYLGINFHAIYSGRMRRQQDTAHPLCRDYQRTGSGNIRPVTLSAFDEYDARALLAARAAGSKANHGLSGDDLQRLRQDPRAFQAYFAETVYAWLDGELDGRPHVEPWARFRERVSAGIQEVTAHNGKGRRVAVFTSGGPISVAMQLALGLDPRKTVELSWQILNASLTVIKYNPSGMTLSVFNNTTPLMMAGDPGLLTYR